MVPTDLQIFEVLPEGDRLTWITLNDGQTRLLDLQPLFTLPTHRTLQLRHVASHPRVVLGGQQVAWPDGTLLDLTSIWEAPYGPLPVKLHALVPQARRYRPVLTVLKALEPIIHTYLDVRPLTTVLPQLGLKTSDWDGLMNHYPAIPSNLLHARLSDLLLLLTTVVPHALLPGVLRQQWHYARHSCPDRPLLHTGDGCIRFGRPDLLEAPLLDLLLLSGGPTSSPPGNAGQMVHSRSETTQRSPASNECEAIRGSEQRGR